jgi:hypothetical protein
MGARRQKLAARGLCCVAKICTEPGHFGRPRVIGHTRKARNTEGGDDPEQADHHHAFDERKTAVSGRTGTCGKYAAHAQIIVCDLRHLNGSQPPCESAHGVIGVMS